MGNVFLIKQKNMEKYKNMFAAAAGMLVVALMSLSSCTKDDMHEVASSLSKTEFIPSSTPTPEPTPVDWNVEKDSLNKGTSYKFSIIAKEKYSGARREVKGEARISLKDYEYFVEDRYRDLDVVFANNNRTFGAPVIVGNAYKRSASFSHEDGQVTTVQVDITNDTDYNVSVEDITLASVRNLEEATTRAQYVSDTLRTEICAEVLFAVNLNGSRYSYTQLLKDTCTRYLLSEDEIAKKEIDYDNQPIDFSSEYFEVITRYTMMSGEKRETSVRSIAPVILETKSFEPQVTESFEWKKSGSDLLYLFGNEELVKVDGFFKHYMTYYLTSVYVGYGTQEVEFLYKVGSCRVVYDDGENHHEWDYKPFEAEEKEISIIQLVSDRDGYEKAEIDDAVEFSYFGNRQAASEVQVLYKEVEPTPAPEPEPVIDGYWDEVTLIDVITDNFRRVSIDWVITTDGVVTDRVNYTKELPRTLVCQTNWTVDADDFSQSTSGLKATLTASSPKSEGSWSWDAETYTITEKVTGAGWNKGNGWQSSEANGISVTRDGKTYYFADKSVDVKSSATVDGSGNYTSRLSYVFGDNTKYSDAPGKINMKAEPEEDPFFPAEWGKIRGAAQTVAPTANHIGHVYTLVFRFDNGTLGVIMNGGEAEINWNGFKHFTADTDQAINGLAYNKGNDRWDFVGADDFADALTYVDMNGKMIDNISYPDAKNADRGNWDKNDYKNGHASVHTDRYQLTINGNVLSIVDTRSGINYGSFTSAE